MFTNPLRRGAWRALALAAFAASALQAEDLFHDIPNEPARASMAPSPNEPRQVGDPNRILMVMFSGFRSCDDADFLENLQTRAVEAVGRKHPEKKVDVVRYCYERSKGSIRVKLPGEKEYRPGKTDIRAALVELGQMQKDYGNTVLIGHSWGGWSVLKAVEGMEKPLLANPNLKNSEFSTPFSNALYDGWEDGARDAAAGKKPKKDPRSDTQRAQDDQKLENDTNGGYWAGYEEGYAAALENQATPAVPPVKASLLVTIDPISGKLGTGCNPGTLLRKSKVCKEFPSDIDQRKVGSGVATWLNYYQDGDERLHSGPASASNTRESQRLEGNHISLKQDPRLEREVAEAIVDSLQ